MTELQNRLHEALTENEHLERRVKELETSLQQAAEAGKGLAKENEQLQRERDEFKQKEVHSRLERKRLSRQSHPFAGSASYKLHAESSMQSSPSDFSVRETSEFRPGSSWSDHTEPPLSGGTSKNARGSIMQARHKLKKGSMIAVGSMMSLRRPHSADARDGHEIYELMCQNEELTRLVDSLKEEKHELHMRIEDMAALTAPTDLEDLSTDAYEKRLHELFDACDVDGDDQLSKRELLSMVSSDKQFADLLGLPERLRSSGCSYEDLEQWFNGLDVHGDGLVSWTEFHAWVEKKRVEESPEHIRRRAETTRVMRSVLDRVRVDMLKREAEEGKDASLKLETQLKELTDRHDKAKHELVSLRQRLGLAQIEGEQRKTALKEANDSLQAERDNATQAKEQMLYYKDLYEEESRKRGEILAQGCHKQRRSVVADESQSDKIPDRVEDLAFEEDDEPPSRRKGKKLVTHNLASQLMADDDESDANDGESEDNSRDARISELEASLDKERQSRREEIRNYEERTRTLAAREEDLHQKVAQLEQALKAEKEAAAQLRSVAEAIEARYARELQEAKRQASEQLDTKGQQEEKIKKDLETHRDELRAKLEAAARQSRSLADELTSSEACKESLRAKMQVADDEAHRLNERLQQSEESMQALGSSAANESSILRSEVDTWTQEALIAFENYNREEAEHAELVTKLQVSKQLEQRLEASSAALAYDSGVAHDEAIKWRANALSALDGCTREEAETMELSAKLETAKHHENRLADNSKAVSSELRACETSEVAAAYLTRSTLDELSKCRDETNAVLGKYRRSEVEREELLGQLHAEEQHEQRLRQKHAIDRAELCTRLQAVEQQELQSQEELRCSNEQFLGAEATIAEEKGKMSQFEETQEEKDALRLSQHQRLRSAMAEIDLEHENLEESLVGERRRREDLERSLQNSEVRLDIVSRRLEGASDRIASKVALVRASEEEARGQSGAGTAVAELRAELERRLRRTEQDEQQFHDDLLRVFAELRARLVRSATRGTDGDVNSDGAPKLRSPKALDLIRVRKQMRWEAEQLRENVTVAVHAQSQCRQLVIETLVPSSSLDPGMEKQQANISMETRPGFESKAEALQDANLVSLVQEMQLEIASLRQESARAQSLELELACLRRRMEELMTDEPEEEDQSLWARLMNQYNSTTSFCCSRGSIADCNQDRNSSPEFGHTPAGCADAAAGSSPGTLNRRSHDDDKRGKERRGPGWDEERRLQLPHQVGQGSVEGQRTAQAVPKLQMPPSAA